MAVSYSGTIKNVKDRSGAVVLPATRDTAVYNASGKTQATINSELQTAIDNACVFTNEADGTKWTFGFSDGKPGFVKVT